MEKSTEINELKIVFIYDRLSCRKEEDDPKDAILYFHPSSISVEKRVAICGQLMGVTHFFNDTFSSPKILTLSNGKFALRNFGEQYVLALGCSSVTSDWLLEKEADILASVIKFFHCDIQSILRNADNDPLIVSNKLTSMMDHYIPISQHHGDLFSLTFGILPILYLPKSANNISLQASVLLQTCMLKTGVLGGIVMYQNKVVGVELGQNLAQKLAFIQPYRMPPADLVKLDFRLPIGVQIFRVYISESEFGELNDDRLKFQNPESSQNHRNASSKKTKNGSNILKNPIKEEADFNLDESHSKNEDSDMSSGIHSDENGLDVNVFNLIRNDKNIRKESSILSTVNGDLPNTAHVKAKPRRCQSVLEIGHNADFEWDLEQKESNEISNTNLLSLKKRLGASVTDPTFPYFTSDGRHSLSSSFHNVQWTESGEDEDRRTTPSNQAPKISPPPQLTSTPTKSPELTPLRPIDLPLHQSNKFNGPQRIKKKLWATFNELISPIEPTESLFENIVNGNDVNGKLSHQNGKLPPPTVLETKTNDMSKIGKSAKIPESIHLRLLNSFRRLSSHDEPLDDGGEGDAECSSGSYSTSNYSETEKLEIQSQSSSSSSYTSFSRNSRLLAPSRVLNSRTKFVGEELRKKQKGDSNSKENDDPRREVALYIYYDGSMRLLLLLHPKVQTNRDLIDAIWEYVSSSVIQLKTSVSNMEEQSSFSNQSDPYCFLRYESIWRSLAHGGRNESMDFNTVQLMHRDFTRHPNVNELIIRGDDHVVYGYQCVGSEVYYQQRAGLQPGLPMPSDLMGKVPLKAKRRLERDHSIVLL